MVHPEINGVSTPEVQSHDQPEQLVPLQQVNLSL
jgi:hypothetical protein